ncbi:MAG: hypothetical protein ACRC92_26225 [Peptostreptococcaceae bacterium]
MEKTQFLYRTYDKGDYNSKSIDEMYWNYEKPYNMVQILRENTDCMGRIYGEYNNDEYEDVCRMVLAETSPLRDSPYRMERFVVEADNLIEHGYTDEEIGKFQKYNTVASLSYLQRLRDDIAMIKDNGNISDIDIMTLSVKVDMLTDRMNNEGMFKKSEHYYDPEALYVVSGYNLIMAGCDLGVKPQDQIAVAYTVKDINNSMQGKDWFNEKDESSQLEICQNLAERIGEMCLDGVHEKFIETLNTLSDIDVYK